MTGAVDLVLPVAKIPEILAKYGRQMVFNGEAEGSGAGRSSPGSVLRSDPKGRCSERSAAAPGSTRALCCRRRTPMR